MTESPTDLAAAVLAIMGAGVLLSVAALSELLTRPAQVILRGLDVTADAIMASQNLGRLAFPLTVGTVLLTMYTVLWYVDDEAPGGGLP